MFLRFVLFKEMDASLRIPLFTASCAFRCCPNSRKQRYWRWFVPLHKAVLLQRRKTRPRQRGGSYFVPTRFASARRCASCGFLHIGFPAEASNGGRFDDELSVLQRGLIPPAEHPCRNRDNSLLPQNVLRRKLRLRFASVLLRRRGG